MTDDELLKLCENVMGERKKTSKEAECYFDWIVARELKDRIERDRWRDAAKEKPENDRIVLVVLVSDGEADTHVARYSDYCHTRHELTGHFKWLEPDFATFEPGERVTHWRPLPASPLPS